MNRTWRMMNRTGVSLPMDEVPPELLEGERTYSGADMEAILTRAAFRAAGTNGDIVTPDLLQDTVNDFSPPTAPPEVELQQMAAVLECTSRDLLPERFRTMKRAEVVERLEELKRMVGSSV